MQNLLILLIIMTEQQKEATIPFVIPQICPTCQEEFQCYCLINKHYWKIRRPGRGYPTNIPLFVRYNHGEAAGQHECEQCGIIYSHKHSLVQHIKAIHFEAKEYSCGECEKSFTQSKGLEWHILNEHGPFYKVRARSQLFHPSEQQGEGLYKRHGTCSCLESDRQYSCSCKANTHYWKNHHQPGYTDGPFIGTHKCNMCGMKFKRNRSLHQHVRHVHLQEVFKCARCSKSFASKQNLTLHLHKVCLQCFFLLFAMSVIFCLQMSSFYSRSMFNDNGNRKRRKKDEDEGGHINQL